MSLYQPQIQHATVEVHNKVHVAEIFIDLARAWYHLQDVTKLFVCGLRGNPDKWFKLYLPNGRESGAVKPDTHIITLVHIEVTQH